jgi:hypothetical protein
MLGAVVSVVKTDDSNWGDLKRPVADALRSSSSLSAFGSKRGPGQVRSDSENPLLASKTCWTDRPIRRYRYGRHVSVTDVKDGVVNADVRVSGLCRPLCCDVAWRRD